MEPKQRKRNVSIGPRGSFGLYGDAKRYGRIPAPLPAPVKTLNLPDLSNKQINY